MSSLHDFTAVACRYEDVPDRLPAFFGGDVRDDAGAHDVGRRGHRARRRDQPVTETENPEYRLLDVSWRPKDGGPYPAFHGTLSVADQGAGWSRIDLDGT